jgi:hypothetical protein
MRVTLSRNPATRVALLCAAMVLTCRCGPASASTLAFWRVAHISGDGVGCLAGRGEDEVELLACHDTCAPIPWQLDERDASGELALNAGPEPNPDDPPGVIDANDELLWMAADAGRRMYAGEAPRAATCGLEVELHGGGTIAWVYAFAVPPPAPRSPLRYVDYDPAHDTIRTARVVIGFGAPTPRYLAVRGADGEVGPNLLDRLKVRASARFLGVIPLGRDEDDIEWQFVAWHAGPIRVVRRERQWVRLGWGLRTPIFRSETLVSRDAIELPVRLRLNFPPTYFFRGIEVQAALDFRDLRGWTVQTPHGPLGAVGSLSGDARTGINGLDGDWLALAGPELTVVLRLQLGDTFASLRRQLLYREDAEGYGPEEIPGEHPAIGFRLTEWGDVDRGQHWFAAIATALPAGYDVDQFAREDAEPLTIETRPLDVAPPGALGRLVPR